MTPSTLIQGAASAVAIAGLVIVVRVGWKALALRRRRANLAAAVDGFLAKRPTVRVSRRLGVGNVGAVVLARLEPGWEDEIALIWKSARPMPAEVVIKVGQFSGGTRKRREVLVQLAGEIESDLESPDPVPICPMLALGFVEGGLPGGNALVEVMPMVEGVALKEAISDGSLGDRGRAIRQLLNILRTVSFLESRNLYNRNLDTENVIVQPSGDWVRIDYDSISRVDELPLERMERLTRLTAAVLGAVGSSAEDMALLARMRQQFRTAPASWRLRGLPLSTEELVAELKSLPGVD